MNLAIEAKKMYGTTVLKKKPFKVVRTDNVKVGDMYDGPAVTADIKFTKTISYRNGWAVPVVVTERNGFNTRIEPLGLHSTCTEFIIQVRYNIFTPATIAVSDFLNYLNRANEVEYNAIKAQLESNASYLIPEGQSFVLEYTVQLTTFEQAQRSIYLEDLDILIYYPEIGIKPIHPYSEKGKLANNGISNDTSFIYKIIINDPHNEFGDKFINVGGNVYRVTAIVDPLKSAGVYLYQTRKAGEERFGELVEEHRYDFDKVKDYISLYSNVEDARTLGDLATAKKREYDQMVHEHKVELQNFEHERRKEQMAHEAAILDLKRKIDIMDQEAKQRTFYAKERMSEREWQEQERRQEWERERRYYEEENYRDKYRREERTSFRKEFMEVLKWLPPLIIGIGALFAKFKVVPA